MSTINETDLLVKYADKKGGGSDGQLIIDDVELSQSRDNRIRHGIGNEDPQNIEKGNRTYTFSTTTHMNATAIDAIRNIDNGDAETQTVYMKVDGVFSEEATGLVFNDITTSSSDGGDTTVSIDGDLLGIEYIDNG
jgi:hypothetical protein